jgi:hypothetical protein
MPSSVKPAFLLNTPLRKIIVFNNRVSGEKQPSLCFTFVLRGINDLFDLTGGLSLTFHLMLRKAVGDSDGIKPRASARGQVKT